MKRNNPLDWQVGLDEDQLGFIQPDFATSDLASPDGGISVTDGGLTNLMVAPDATGGGGGVYYPTAPEPVLASEETSPDIATMTCAQATDFIRSTEAKLAEIKEQMATASFFTRVRLAVQQEYHTSQLNAAKERASVACAVAPPATAPVVAVTTTVTPAPVPVSAPLPVSTAQPTTSPTDPVVVAAPNGNTGVTGIGLPSGAPVAIPVIAIDPSKTIAGEFGGGGTGGAAESSGAPAAAPAKKPTPWLLYGALAAGAFVLYKVAQKN